MNVQKTTFDDTYSELPIHPDRKTRLLSSENLLLHWKIGKYAHSNINRFGKDKIQVFKELLESLAEYYNCHYSVNDLKKAERFYVHYPDVEYVKKLAMRITWSHINELSVISNGFYYNLYVDLCINERWTSSCLRNKIKEHKSLNAKLKLSFEEDNSVFALVRVKNDNRDFNWALLHRELHRLVAVVIIMGPFKAVYLNQIELYLRHLNETERKKGEEAPLGLILCVDENTTCTKLFQLDILGIKEIDFPKDFLLNIL